MRSRGRSKPELRVATPEFTAYVERLIVLLKGDDAVASDHEAGAHAVRMIEAAIANDEVPYTLIDDVQKLRRRLNSVVED